MVACAAGGAIKIMTSEAVFCIRLAMLYAVIAMTGGLYMAISGDHTALVAHAHMAIIGWFGLLTTGFLFVHIPQLGQDRLAWLIVLMLAIGLPVMTLGVALIAYNRNWAEPLAVIGALTVYGAVVILGLRVWTTKVG